MLYLIGFLLYFIIFCYGLVIGSFLNVVILRLPIKENIVSRSHCMSCGYQLAWYDLVPLFSWLFLRGKCRKCGVPISKQYPIVEAANGLLYLMITICCGLEFRTILLCLLGSALLALSVIDFRTYEIPMGFNIFITILGVINLILDRENWMSYLIGAVSVSAFLWIIYLISKGNAIGGGDVKLMFSCGLLIGFPKILLAFIVGCILGAVIHTIRMKVSGEGRVLAMGPYLAAGVMLAVLFGEQFLTWYLRMW